MTPGPPLDVMLVLHRCRTKGATPALLLRARNLPQRNQWPLGQKMDRNLQRWCWNLTVVGRKDEWKKNLNEKKALLCAFAREFRTPKDSVATVGVSYTVEEAEGVQAGTLLCLHLQYVPGCESVNLFLWTWTIISWSCVSSSPLTP